MTAVFDLESATEVPTMVVLLNTFDVYWLVREACVRITAGFPGLVFGVTFLVAEIVEVFLRNRSSSSMAAE